MPLTLKVLTFKGQPAPQSAVISMNNQGGTIGRSNDNTLVLPDEEKFVSRHHATVSMENGLYYLTDNSLSGVFINGQHLHDSTQQITHGMLLKIGEYEIAVAIDIDDAQPDEDFPFAPIESVEQADYFLPLDDFGDNRLLREQDSSIVTHEDLIQSSGESIKPVFESQLQGGSSALFDSFVAPAVTNNPFAAVEDIPENFSFEDLLAESPPQQNTPAATPPPVKHQIAEQRVMPNNAAFDAFLQGVGIQYRAYRTEPLTDTLYRIGQMFRHLIVGAVSVLRSRTEFKSLFRINMTRIKATNNNPLKFTVATDDIIRQFLDNKSDGFLGSIEAIDQGFNDMVNHQQAMEVGIQAAVAELLKSFDPKLIEKQLDQGLVLQKKAKCWDKYQEIYRQAAPEAMENFFTDAFADAYQQKMAELQGNRHHL
ncbi:MAG: type VI secretion system-associated FHA domain protein TagH [Methylococcaceae bacterium]|nr:type VI secretion system-associated FHA domain protein TagH [Methylococcaceae bacterium]